MTDKNIDKEVSKQLKDKITAKENVISKYFSNLFSRKKPNPVVINEPPKIEPVKFHIVTNGDSLWIIANKYYSNPSPDNINKIMKANNMKRAGMLSIGQKLVIPQ